MLEEPVLHDPHGTGGEAYAVAQAHEDLAEAETPKGLTGGRDNQRNRDEDQTGNG